MFRYMLPVVLPLALAACQNTQPTPLPDTSALTAPASPVVAIRHPRAVPIVTDYMHHVPVDPKPWQLLNQSQAPNSGAGS
ncbi:hypothetical protein ACSSV1_005649 [Labrenzia sp. MBR-25]